MTATSSPPRTPSKDEIRRAVLGAQDRAFEYVDVPEWGGITIKVQALSGTARDRYQAANLIFGTNAKGAPAITGYNLAGATARLVALSIVDEDGAAVFSDKDILDLGDRSPVALDRVADVARRLSGLTEEAVEAAKAGFADSPSDSSGSV